MLEPPSEPILVSASHCDVGMPKSTTLAPPGPPNPDRKSNALELAWPDPAQMADQGPRTAALSKSAPALPKKPNRKNSQGSRPVTAKAIFQGTSSQTQGSLPSSDRPAPQCDAFRRRISRRQGSLSPGAPRHKDHDRIQLCSPWVAVVASQLCSTPASLTGASSKTGPDHHPSVHARCGATSTAGDRKQVVERSK